MTARPRIILADDHALVADALAHLLADTCELVEVTHDGNQLVESVRRHRPDVILADIAMPGMSGLDALRAIRAGGLTTPVIFLTMYADAAIAAEGIKAGASGFLLKNSAGDELTTAIADVLKGQLYLTPLFAREILGAMSAPARSGLDRLTSQQRRVLGLIVQGRSMKEIAAAMNLSPRTVETHKYEMMHALHLETTADLIRFALETRVEGASASPSGAPLDVVAGQRGA